MGSSACQIVARAMMRNDLVLVLHTRRGIRVHPSAGRMRGVQLLGTL